MNRLLAILVALLVGAAVVAGLLVVGGPGHARKERNDQTRLDHLRRIGAHEQCRLAQQTAPEAEVPVHCAKELPVVDLRDPVTDTAYEIRQRDPTTFEVCARMETDALKPQNAPFSQLHFDGKLACLRFRQRSSDKVWIEEGAGD
ncbi:MAG: hypothetical protein HKN30_02940 [Sulfitobacter sp.]|nr:hypothetical protein [Sulfitobacter sp.]